LRLLNSGELRELPASFSGETVHFRCMWTPTWSFPCRDLRHDVLSHANPTSPPSSSPSRASSSPTPASSSIVVVHLWPKVSTPSRSCRRFLSVLPFNLQFHGCSHLIPFAFFLCLYRWSRPPWPNRRAGLFPPSPSSSTAGEPTTAVPSSFSLRSVPQSSP
jgi:hypothetical protein